MANLKTVIFKLFTNKLFLILFASKTIKVRFDKTVFVFVIIFLLYIFFNKRIINKLKFFQIINKIIYRKNWFYPKLKPALKPVLAFIANLLLNITLNIEDIIFPTRFLRLHLFFLTQEPVFPLKRPGSQKQPASHLLQFSDIPKNFFVVGHSS